MSDQPDCSSSWVMPLSANFQQMNWELVSEENHRSKQDIFVSKFPRKEK